MSFLPSRKKKLHGVLLDHDAAGDDRCQACGGVCCRSFAAIEIDWEEYERLKVLGATRLHFPLYGPPRLEIDYDCEFLADGRCSIYERRPDVCRRFTCREDE